MPDSAKMVEIVKKPHLISALILCGSGRSHEWASLGLLIWIRNDLDVQPSIPIMIAAVCSM